MGCLLASYSIHPRVSAADHHVSFRRLGRIFSFFYSVRNSRYHSPSTVVCTSAPGNSDWLFRQA